jgi:hypothetical protein
MATLKETHPHSVLKFNEKELAAQLDHLIAPLRAAFAAAAAERLMVRYKASHPRGQPLLEGALDALWRALFGEGAGQRLSEFELQCMDLMEKEDPQTAMEEADAEDVTAAVIYSLRALGSDNSRDAIWAARRAYEALDQAAVNSLGVDFQEPDAEEKVLMDPAIQSELRSQQRDLLELEKLPGPGPSLTALRQRARHSA